MSTEGRSLLLKSCSVILGLLGLWLGVGTFITLIHGLRENEGYHQREFRDALPTLCILTVVGVGFLIAAWSCWRASRRSVTKQHDNAA
jgi:hypothetical protein